jgi:hypothetical protein
MFVVELVEVLMKLKIMNKMSVDLGLLSSQV